LVSLGKLRQFCVHPFQLTGEWGNPAIGNAKYERFLEILEEIFARKEKVLVFIEYLHASDLFSKDLHERFAVYVDAIDGRIPIGERQAKVDRFSAHSGSAVFLLNPRTAGVGLNLTAANHVIHFGPDWNPAVEDQASARSHRRGQIRPVTVHRMFFVDSVEDIIIQRLEHKRQLAELAVVGTKGDGESREEILRALRASPIRRENR
jgi:SNF2 family DNA or RNA helicase